jgi:anti-anti-sigma factor
MTTERPQGSTDPLTIEGTDSGDFWYLMRLSGEFDMNGSTPFRSAVKDALRRGRRHIAVDAGAVTFMDSSGLLALMSARADIEAAEGTFRLTTVSDSVARLLDLVALSDELLDRRHGRRPPT